MKCEEMIKQINEYIDGELDPSICDDFRNHLEECCPCRIMVDTIKNTITLYQKCPEECDLPPGLHKRLHESLSGNWKIYFRQRNRDEI